MVEAPLSAAELALLEAAGLGELGARLLKQLAHAQHEISWRDARIEKLSFEMAQLKRMKFAATSEHLNAQQRALFDESVDADIAALEEQLQELIDAKAKPSEPRVVPRRAALPASLPRVERHHEPHNITCTCGCALKRIGEDVSEKLDYTPGVFTVQRHIRGKWSCAQCRTLTQAPVPAEIIDKGIATSSLLAQVLVAKYADHLPLYRQEQIFARAGLALPRSTLASWVGTCGVRLQPLVDALKAHVLDCAVLHADETPLAMLAPGKGKTHRAFLWAYATGPYEALRAVIYDFADSRAGEHAREFLGDWRGSLVCDDYAGYKASFEQGVTEVGCMAHARRKFFELHVANKSTIAATAIEFIKQLYEVEREVKTLQADERLKRRREQAAPIAKALHDWLIAQRTLIPDGTATAKAIDYSLKRWVALTRYLDDAALPIDNNFDEQQIRPWATGRKNWLFAGTLMAGQRAAAIMSLIQSAKLNGHDPYAYMKDILARLPTQPMRLIDELLPHRWVPQVEGV
ncbi:IS66 family transposase [Caenimonas koreensis]|uniref:IS66 family transposase n=1 Tax=Caenimonas koreensis TaxID=367474 RepID=UPI003784B371